MTTAENLLRAKQDYDDVYTKAYEKGKSEGGGLPDDMKWAKHTETVTIRDLNWGTETTVLNFPNIKSQNFGFTVRNTTVKHLIINYGVPLTTLDRGFYWGSDGGVMEHLTLNGDTSQTVSFRQLFSAAPHLKIIDGSPLDFSSSTNNTALFPNCNYLYYIRIVPNSIKVNANFSGTSKWDDDSIQSIIDGLADLTGGTTQDLTLHTNVVTRLTEAQWAQIYAKNWQVM